MFKKKCKCTTCFFRLGRTGRCSLDKKCFLLCKGQQKNLTLRDIRIMYNSQKIIEKINRGVDKTFNEYIKESF